MEFYQQKLKDWLQRLHHLQAEIVQHKTDLAKMLGNLADKKKLLEVEYFQTQFLKQDAAISLLRHELDLKQGFTGHSKKNEAMRYDAGEQHDMERIISTMEDGWLILKQVFNKTLKRELLS